MTGFRFKDAKVAVGFGDAVRFVDGLAIQLCGSRVAVFIEEKGLLEGAQTIGQLDDLASHFGKEV